MYCFLDAHNTDTYGDGMTNRLTPEDWMAAGFRALAEIGPQALKAEPLARRLGTTKGSFYWHFKDVPAFQNEMLKLWEDKAVIGIIERLATLPTPQERLRVLARQAGAPAPERFGGRNVEPAIRAWSLHNDAVADGVAKVDAGRIAYVEELLSACDRPTRYGKLIYGAYVGLDDLAAKGASDSAEALADLVELILR